jgi:hypothetical protein
LQCLVSPALLSFLFTRPLTPFPLQPPRLQPLQGNSFARPDTPNSALNSCTWRTLKPHVGQSSHTKTMAHRSRSSRDYPDGHRHRSSRSREYTSEKPRSVPPPQTSDRRDRRGSSLPQYNHNGHKVTPGLHPEGESGRRGFNPIKFLVITGRSSSTPSMLVNCLWPIVPIAIALVSVPCQRSSPRY